MSKIAAYGSWASPLTAATVASAEITPRWVELRHGQVWWTENRPDQGGRVTLLRSTTDGDPLELLPPPWNARNRVHEYGGRPWTLLDHPTGHHVAFTNWDDQRIYRIDPDGASQPVPLSPAPHRHHGTRYSDLRPSPDGTHVWCVRETVTGDHPTDIHRDLIALPADATAATDPNAIRTLAASHRFLTSPTWSPDHRHAAWIGWNHPHMPWDGTELCVAPVRPDGTFGPHQVLAGGTDHSVCQVEWDTPDTLLALTDPDGWWNLHRIHLDGTTTNLAPHHEDLGGALWQLGYRWFTSLGSGRHAVLRRGRLAVLDERSATITDIDLDADFPVWTQHLTAADGHIAGAAGGPTRELTVVRLDLSNGRLTELTRQPTHLPPTDHLPRPTERFFRDPDGRKIPAYVYPPRNPDHTAPDHEKPPYLVHVHGGPTSSVSSVLDLEIAYFTSRGIGVVAVNYGGSTGFGRQFRNELRGQWGVVDVQDCATVATALAEEGTADPHRLAIRGGSAGGWTSAVSMTSIDTYRCATIKFPILDLARWCAQGGETHDFEAHYIESLVGTLPEHEDRYTQRSPINHIDKLTGPVLLLQGLDDKVCPPEQAHRFVSGLAGTGTPHAYLTFEGEQHGFRKAENIATALEAELSFYGQVFGFTPPGIPELALHR